MVSKAWRQPQVPPARHDLPSPLRCHPECVMALAASCRRPYMPYPTRCAVILSANAWARSYSHGGARRTSPVPHRARF